MTFTFLITDVSSKIDYFLQFHGMLNLSNIDLQINIKKCNLYKTVDKADIKQTVVNRCRQINRVVTYFPLLSKITFNFFFSFFLSVPTSSINKHPLTEIYRKKISLSIVKILNTRDLHPQKSQPHNPPEPHVHSYPNLCPIPPPIPSFQLTNRLTIHSNKRNQPWLLLTGYFYFLLVILFFIDFFHKFIPSFYIESYFIVFFLFPFFTNIFPLVFFRFYNESQKWIYNRMLVVINSLCSCSLILSVL